MGEIKDIYDDAFFAHQVKELVQEHSNDSTLGAKIRALYWQAMKSND